MTGLFLNNELMDLLDVADEDQLKTSGGVVAMALHTIFRETNELQHNISASELIVFQFSRAMINMMHTNY